MSFRTTLILFLLFALMVGGYVGYNQWKIRNTATTPKLFEVDPLAIQRLEVTQADRKVVYQKSFLKIWEMQEPRYNVVDSRVIETATVLLSALQLPELKNPSSNLTEYGIAPPQFTVRITLANNTTHTLFFGNKTPDGRIYYMQKENDPKIYLMPAQLGDPVLDLFRSPPVTPTPTPTRTETPWPAHIPTETVTPTWTPWPTLTATPYKDPTVTMTPTSTPVPRTPQPLVIGTSTPVPPTTPTPTRTPGL